MFSAGGNWFSQVGKNIRTELHCKKNFPLGLDRCSNQLGKIVLTAGQLHAALTETPAN